MSPCSDNSEVDEDWRNKDKHIFVLSEAGKPIYTLHGDEELIISLFGVMQVGLQFLTISILHIALQQLLCDFDILQTSTDNHTMTLCTVVHLGGSL